MKLRTHCPPSRLAVYMARSAWRSSWSTVQLEAGVATVKPMLGRTETGTPSITIAVLKASRTRWAAACASSTEPRRSTANSSPPSRAMVSLLSRTAVSRPATRTSSSSPAGWPSASLTCLKLSRSRHNRAKELVSCCSRATDSSNRCRKKARLASPVRLSRKASRATSDNSFRFSSSTRNWRASTAAASRPSAASIGPCAIRPTAWLRPTAAATSSGR
ncbi:hypothetical protein BN971_01631 [Mycobacterium bohemicum DSM 44277]|uniref:Uncharacterized protein n=1 Tax=Mycobacterium bohemicum DSM 44277 TaxID=1236609 RepID=A0A0U0W657_MYCBE|nr:hypothetical protein BN971_01631 [Mycobacterium bohemicum DSM 44277]